MILCPQCKEAIEGMAPKTYGVGWCRQDVHVGSCLALHIRACRECRPKNEDVIARQAL